MKNIADNEIFSGEPEGTAENVSDAAPEVDEPTEPAEPAPEGDEPTEPAEPAPEVDEPTEPAEPAPEGDEPTEPAEPAPEGDEQTPSDVSDSLKVSVITSDDFGYVIPQETFKQHHRHRRRRKAQRRRKKKEDPRSQEELDQMAEGFVFVSSSGSSGRSGSSHKSRRRRRRHRKWRHLKWWKKALFIIVVIALALTIVFGSTFLILREIGRSNMHNYDDIAIVPPADDVMNIDQNGKLVYYDGKAYALNENIVSITFIGADDGTEDTDDRRMSDAIYILTVDTLTGKVRILGISRDTMADVDRYSVEGKYMDTVRQQIAYSYSYYSDRVTGGANTNASLSKLFFGLPMKNYFAINLDALNDLNNAVGGVTLTSSMTFTSPVDGRTISEGETVTLHGREAERYVRSRDTTKLESNNERMQRQQQYIRAFLDSLVPAVKQDISRIGTLYNVVNVNSDSNLGLPDLTYLASTVLPKLRSASDIEYVTLKGEITAGEHAEMNITNDEAIRTMLEVFYLPHT